MSAGINFPASMSVLWDHQIRGTPVQVHPAYYRNLKVELDEKALRIASRYTAERENGMGYSQCFLLGNLAVHGDGEGVCVHLDRFDPGRESGCRETAVPTTQGPGEIAIPYNIATNENRLPILTEEYAKAINILQRRVCSNDKIELASFFWNRVTGKYHGDRQKLTLTLDWDMVTLAAQFCATPISPIPILPTALSKNLSGPVSQSHVQGQPKTGYLTMDKTRKLLLMLESDPKARSLPIVGIWASGPTYVYEPFLWACCLRYVHNSSIQKRTCMPPEPFLLVLYPPAHLKPQFYDVTLDSNDKTHTFQLHTSHETIAISKTGANAVEVELNPVESGLKKDSFETAMESCKDLLKNETSRKRNDLDVSVVPDDIEPRAVPSPQQLKAPAVLPSVPDVSLIYEDEDTPVTAPPQPFNKDHVNPKHGLLHSRHGLSRRPLGPVNGPSPNHVHSGQGNVKGMAVYSQVDEKKGSKKKQRLKHGPQHAQQSVAAPPIGYSENQFPRSSSPMQWPGYAPSPAQGVPYGRHGCMCGLSVCLCGAVWQATQVRSGHVHPPWSTYPHGHYSPYKAGAAPLDYHGYHSGPARFQQYPTLNTHRYQRPPSQQPQPRHSSDPYSPHLLRHEVRNPQPYPPQVNPRDKIDIHAQGSSVPHPQVASQPHQLIDDLHYCTQSPPPMVRDPVDEGRRDSNPNPMSKVSSSHRQSPLQNANNNAIRDSALNLSTVSLSMGCTQISTIPADPSNGLLKSASPVHRISEEMVKSCAPSPSCPENVQGQSAEIMNTGMDRHSGPVYATAGRSSSLETLKTDVNLNSEKENSLKRDEVLSPEAENHQLKDKGMVLPDAGNGATSETSSPFPTPGQNFEVTSQPGTLTSSSVTATLPSDTPIKQSGLPPAIASVSDFKFPSQATLGVGSVASTPCSITSRLQSPMFSTPAGVEDTSLTGGEGGSAVIASPEVYHLLMQQENQIRLLQAQLQQLLQVQLQQQQQQSPTTPATPSQSQQPSPLGLAAPLFQGLHTKMEQLQQEQQTPLVGASPLSQGYVSMEASPATLSSKSASNNAEDRKSTLRCAQQADSSHININKDTPLPEQCEEKSLELDCSEGVQAKPVCVRDFLSKLHNSFPAMPGDEVEASQDAVASLSMSLSSIQVAAPDTTTHSVASDMIVDIPSYPSSPSRSPERSGKGDNNSNGLSPYHNIESVSMYEEEEPGEEPLEAEGDKEDSLLSQDQKLYYENLIGNVHQLLARHAALEEKSDEDREVDDHLPPSSVCETGSTKAPSSQKDVATVTMEQLKKMGIESKEGPEENNRPPSSSDAFLLNTLSYSPSSAFSKVDESTFGYDAALLPHINYMSLMLDTSSSDLSADFNNLAMKYLSDEQLTQISKWSKSKKRGGSSSQESLLHKVLTASTAAGPSKANMSYASRKYMERYGLLEEEDDDEGSRFIGDESGYRNVADRTTHDEMEQSTDHAPLMKTVSFFLKRAVEKSDLSEHDSQDAERDETNSGSGSLSPTRDCGRDAFTRSALKTPVHQQKPTASTEQEEKGMILDIQKLKQMPKLM